MNDQEIVELFFRRDQLGILEAQEKYGAYCLTVARNILGSEEDSQECLNDLWLRVWNAIPPERPQLLRAFLSRIIRNLAINCHRAKFARKRVEDQYTLSLEELSGCIPDPRTTEETLWTKELTAQLNAFLETEKALDRKIFVRRYFYCQSCPEIAGALGLSQGQVKTRLCRCRERLRKFLEAREVYL